MYFAAMAFANLANIITYYLAGPLIRGSLSTFANCVSLSMMSRLMLNLHAKANTGILSELNFEEAAPLDVREPVESPVVPQTTPLPILPEVDPEPEPPGDISTIF